MSDFNLLLATALVGTSRAPLPLHADTPLADVLNSVKRNDTESTLLARAALAGLATRAGQLPESAPQLPAPPPAETRPEAPPRVTRHLTHVLNTPVLAEWLTLCTAAGWRVPHASLPDLLDWGAAVSPELRVTLRPALGERGRWLAGFAEHWRWLRGLDSGAISVDDEAWESATEAAREHLFRGLRADDAAAARTFLSARFKTEKASVRKRLLDVLAQTWQEGDTELEPLFEDALTDRSEDVRIQTRRLLQRWPGSAYNGRLSARVADMLKPEKVGLLGRLTGQSKFGLALLETPDADLKRDGLEDVKHPAERLRQLLEAAHPDTLLAALNMTPAELARLAREFEAHDELTAATLRTGHSALAEALLGQVKKGGLLLTLASPERRNAELRAALGRRDLDVVQMLLEVTPAPWPRDLSAAVLEAIQDAVKQAGKSSGAGWSYRWGRLLEGASLHADPSAPRPAPLFVDPLEFEAQALVRQTLDVLYATLDLRAQMHADFAADVAADAASERQS